MLGELYGNIVSDVDEPQNFPQLALGRKSRYGSGKKYDKTTVNLHQIAKLVYIYNYGTTGLLTLNWRNFHTRLFRSNCIAMPEIVPSLTRVQSTIDPNGTSDF